MSRNQFRLIIQLGVMAVVLLLTLAGGRAIVQGASPHSQSGPATIMVINTDDSGPGSLRDALQISAPGDTIRFSITGTITLTTGELTVDKDLTIQGPNTRAITISGNHASRVFNVTSGSVVISGLTIADGSAEWGGGLSTEPGVDLTISACVFKNNTASGNCTGISGSGGGLLNQGALGIQKGSFEGNESNCMGGGLYSSTTVNLTDTTFLNNTASDGLSNGKGGGVYATQGTMTGGWFQENTANVHGGGICSAGNWMITGTHFISNHTAGSGGGAYGTNFTSYTLTDVLFRNNSAVDTGGGLSLYSGTHELSTLQGAQFISNTAQWGGGAYISTDASLVGGQFLDNEAFVGGGWYQYAGVLSLTGTEFISNTGALGGGGLYNFTDAITITQALFENNHSDSDSGGSGGGILSTGPVSLSDSRFYSNTASTHGGGIVVQNDITMTRVLLIDNQARLFGGGLYHSFGDALLTNCLLARNTAGGSGGALSLSSSGASRLLHVTIADPALADQTAVYLTDGTLYMYDTILSNYSLGVRNFNGTLVQDYNLFFGNGTDISGVYSGGSRHFRHSRHLTIV